MADTKISALTALTQLDPADELPLNDASAVLTKKVTHENIKDWRLSTVGLYLPSVAGFNPAAAAEIGYDSTQRRIQSSDGVADGALARALSVQLGNGGATDLDAAASGADGTTEKTFATNFAIPANFLIANKVLLLTVHLQVTTSGTAPTWIFRVKLGSTNVFAGVAAALANSQVTRGYSLQFQIQGTAAAGASVAVMVGGPIAITGGGYINWANTVAQSVAAIATNGALTLQCSGQWGTATTANTIRLHQFIVEELN